MPKFVKRPRQSTFRNRNVIQNKCKKVSSISSNGYFYSITNLNLCLKESNRFLHQ